MYGPNGWTVDSGVQGLLGEYFEHKPVGDLPADFRRFARARGKAVVGLADILPCGNLSDRQNGAPSCGELLSLSKHYPGQTALSGYLVGPARDDERVSFDGLWVQCKVLGGLKVRKWLEKQFETSETQFPDEILFAVDPDGTAWWHFWWD